MLDQQKLPAARIEELLEAHPFSKVLTSMPGIGVRTEARILIDVGDGSSVPSAAHLAAYASLAQRPAVPGRRSEANNPPRERKQTAQTGPLSIRICRTYRPGLPDLLRKKISQGKHHAQALLCLARRRADVHFAMLRDGTIHGPQPAPSA
ncbi:transposase [Streptomyces glaucescens]|uniref:Transposase IS116/IS110/IS902 C-terminal domain-containing protein n=1 Tax=Streptomyces glaucescens TaxID=1907 RepID=A0A089XGW8_STRGA|nr:hypothetical protein SGLAU_33020 [Streptomyces glaucescens]